MEKYKVYIKGGGECYVDAETNNEAITKARKNCPNVINRVKKIKL